MRSRTIYDVLEEAVQAYGNAPALQQPCGKGQYQAWTWPEYRDAVREVACGLRGLGVGKGDIVALYSETRAEFYLADIGIMAAGAIAAALYTSYPAADLIKTLRAAEPKIIFAENSKSMEMLVKAAGSTAPLQAQWVLL